MKFKTAVSAIFVALCYVAVARAADPPTKNRPSVSSAKESADLNSKSLRVPAGYRRKIVKGEVKYCTRTTIIGSRFPKDICVDEQGLQALNEQREDDQQALRRQQSVCSTAAACSAN
jgi:hypothetical protein